MGRQGIKSEFRTAERLRKRNLNVVGLNTHKIAESSLASCASSGCLLQFLVSRIEEELRTGLAFRSTSCVLHCNYSRAFDLPDVLRTGGISFT